MSIVTCPDCGKQLSNTANCCPNCGHRRPKSKTWLWVTLGIVAVFFIFGHIASNTPEGKEKARQRDVIDLCRDEAKKHPGNQIAEGTCKMLEDKFQKQFGHRP